MYTNLNNPVNYQLQDFGQFGFRVLDSTSMVVDGETYRTLYVVDDAVVSATTSKGDDLVSKPLLSGTLLHGLFSAPTVASGKVLAYMAGRLTAEEILELYTAYLTAIAGTTLENTDCLYDDLNHMGADTYADASLVLIPSGYSTGVVYGQRPLDSNSQITFTRASDATRVINGGLIEKVRTNLLLQSNQFDTTWVNSNSTETSGQAGYDGTNNAWLLDKTGANGYIGQTVSYSGLYTQSIYVKAGTSNWLAIQNAGLASSLAYFDLQNGVIGSAQANVLYHTIESIGSGWYRCSAAYNGASGQARFFVADSDNSTSGTSGNILIQSAQFEAGDIATDYIATGASAVSVGPVSNVPRIDYTGGGCGKLLLEPQRTNVALYSEQFDNATWTKSGCTATANALISPSGYQDADEINMAAPDASLLRQIVTVTASTAYTFSFYVKRGTATNLRYNVRDITNSTDITAKVDYTAQTSTTSWSRILVTFTTPVGCTSVGIFPNRDSSSAGTFYVWGAQLEAGAYATSYIPTLASSVTRVADAASKTGISNLIGQTEGTLFVELAAFVGANEDRQISINDGSTSNRITMALLSNGTQIQFVVQTGGSVVMNSTQTIAGLTTGVKIAYAYKLNDFAVYVNGVQIATDTSGAVPISPSALSFDSGNASDKFFGKVAQALVFKTRLTPAQLAALTTL